MHIFVDESGAFIPLDGTRARVSCVGALVVPDAHLERLFKEWEELRSSIRPGAAELKGSGLNEEEIISVLKLLKRFDVIFDTCCIDAGQHHGADVDEFQTEQAERIIAGLPSDAPESDATKEVHALAEMAKKLSQQEFLQSFVTIRFLHTLVPLVTNYYAQRRPKELAKFHWVIDAKDTKRVRAEEFWTQLVLPALERASEMEPFGTFPFGDYTYFERHMLPGEEVLKRGMPEGTFLINASQVYQEDLQFADSKDKDGLQLCDIVVSACSRLLNGHLHIRVADELGALMIHSRPSPLKFAALKTRRFPAGHRPMDGQQDVSRVLYRTSRPMVAKKYRQVVRAAKDGSDA